MSTYKQHHLRNLDRSLLIVCFTVLGITIVYPSVRLLLEALPAWQWDLILKGSGREAIINTLGMCVA
ncbi:MAG TPA: hypothetical protein EYN96_13290, partial [Candidatus Hydrogenedentes bacterium]|nr:hypothetical protein [Candidatus Hydrogenedentota bacterium]